MKTFIAALTLAALSAISHAQSSSDLEKCKSVSEVAGNIMKYRQGGQKMSDAMAIAVRGDVLDNLMKAIVIRAWEEPMYRTPEAKGRTAIEFENIIYLECVQAAIRRDEK